MTRPRPAIRLSPSSAIPLALLVGWLRVVAGLAAVPDDPLIDVAVRGRSVYATTATGIHRASTDRKVWESMAVPESMPLGRGFARGTNSDGAVYYDALSRSGLPGSPPTPADRVLGLYRLPAESDRWELAFAGEAIERVLILGTNVYRFAPAPLPATVPRIVVSDLRGKPLREIPYPDAKPLSYPEIFPDPAHPGLICIEHWALRTCVWHADDERYDWKWHRGDRSRVGPVERPAFPGETFRSRPALPLVAATLGNYFAMSFDGSLHVGGIGLAASGPRRFAAGSNVTVDVELALRVAPPKGPVHSVVDLAGRTDFWGLRRVTPTGRREYFGPTAPTNAGAARSSGDWKAVPLGAGDRYRRSLDLSAIAPFPLTGTYRVQVLYGSEQVADPKKREWELEVAGPVMEIEITRE